MIWDQYRIRRFQPHPDNYVRVLPGRHIWKDWYRWFICLFSGRVIWFYQSDVAGFEIIPPYTYAEVGAPVRRHVRLFVELSATDHLLGTDS